MWIMGVRHTAYKVDLACQGLIEIFTEGEVDPRFPQEDMLRGVCSRPHII